MTRTPPLPKPLCDGSQSEIEAQFGPAKRAAKHVAVVSLAALLIVGLGASGCSKRRGECGAIVGIVNPAIEQIKAASAASTGRAEDYVRSMEEVAKAAESVQVELSKLKLTVPELKTQTAAYQALAGELATGARDMVQALRQVEASGKELAKAAEAAKAAVDTHTRACGPATDDAEACKAFAEAMTKLPDHPSKVEEAKAIIASIEKLTFKAADTKASSARVIKALTAQTTAIEQMNKASRKADEAERQFKSASEREDGIVDAINKLCAN